MSTNVDDPSVISRAMDWAWAAVLALIGVIWHMLNRRLDGKANKELTNHRLNETLALLKEHVIEDKEVHQQIVVRLDMTNAQLNQIIGELKK